MRRPRSIFALGENDFRNVVLNNAGAVASAVKSLPSALEPRKGAYFTP
jgi:hypothetical protein